MTARPARTPELCHRHHPADYDGHSLKTLRRDAETPDAQGEVHLVAGQPMAGSGITLTTALTRAHAAGAQAAGNVPTPGAPNRYYRRAH